MIVKTYDAACYELAEHFLQDEPISEHSTPYEQACRDLALAIQQAVEDWFGEPSISSTEHNPVEKIEGSQS